MGSKNETGPRERKGTGKKHFKWSCHVSALLQHSQRHLVDPFPKLLHHRGISTELRLGMTYSSSEMSQCHLQSLLGLKNLFLIIFSFCFFSYPSLQKMTEAFKKNFWLIYFKKSTLYINMIKTITLNNHKCLYKIINITEVKHTYKMSPLTILDLLQVYFHTLLPQQKDKSHMLSLKSCSGAAPAGTLLLAHSPHCVSAPQWEMAKCTSVIPSVTASPSTKTEQSLLVTVPVLSVRCPHLTLAVFSQTLV